MSESIAAVVFDLDGVLVDSESVWDAARREVVARNGGRWHGLFNQVEALTDEPRSPRI